MTTAHELLNPFELTSPDQVSKLYVDGAQESHDDESADSGIDTSSIAFHPSGTYLALGGIDGQVHLFDMLTLRLARSFAVHSPNAVGLPSAVLSISWLKEREGRRGPKRGNLLLSTGEDNTACLCDVDANSIVVRLHLGTAAAKVTAHPRAPLLWLVCFSDMKLDSTKSSDTRRDTIRWPILVDIAAFRKAGMDLLNLKLSEAPRGAVFVLDCLNMKRWRPSVQQQQQRMQDNRLEEARVAAQTDAGIEAMETYRKKKPNKCAGVTAAFSTSGDVIFVGGLGSAIIVLKTIIPTAKSSSESIGSTGIITEGSADKPKGKEGVKRAMVVSISTPNVPGGLAKGTWARGLALRNDKVIAVYSTGKSFCLYKIPDLPKPRTPSPSSEEANAQNTNEKKGEKRRPEPLRVSSSNISFQDNVNNTKWLSCVLSGDGEFVVGVVSTKGKHALHVWDVFGSFIGILECPTRSRGEMRDCCWHPSRPIVACADSAGDIFLWSKKHSENWSAFAPNFTQIEDSVEYVEREDEFDVDEQAGIVFASDAPNSNKRLKTEQGGVVSGSNSSSSARVRPTSAKELASATAAVVLGRKNSEEVEVDVITVETRAAALSEEEALAEDEEEKQCDDSECVGSLLTQYAGGGGTEGLPFYCRVDRSSAFAADVPVSVVVTSTDMGAVPAISPARTEVTTTATTTTTAI